MIVEAYREIDPATECGLLICRNEIGLYGFGFFEADEPTPNFDCLYSRDQLARILCTEKNVGFLESIKPRTPRLTMLAIARIGLLVHIDEEHATVPSAVPLSEPPAR